MEDNDIDKRKAKFLEYYRKLPIIKLAAGHVGRNRDTIYVWMKDDPTFSAQVELAKSEWALSRAGNIKSDEWLLERVLREHFSPRQEVTGAEGEDLFKKTNERLETDYKKLAERARREMVALNSPVQDQDQGGGTTTVLPEYDPNEAHGTEGGSQAQPDTES